MQVLNPFEFQLLLLNESAIGLNLFPFQLLRVLPQLELQVRITQLQCLINFITFPVPLLTKLLYFNLVLYLTELGLLFIQVKLVLEPSDLLSHEVLMPLDISRRFLLTH